MTGSMFHQLSAPGGLEPTIEYDNESTVLSVVAVIIVITAPAAEPSDTVALKKLVVNLGGLLTCEIRRKVITTQAATSQLSGFAQKSH